MASTSFTWTVHTVGPPIGWVQSCVSCGLVLCDNVAWGEGRVAVLAGDEGLGPAWFPEGALVGSDEVAGQRAPRCGCTYVIEGRELDADEKLCAGAN